MISKAQKTVIPAVITVIIIAAVFVGCAFTGAKTQSLSGEDALGKLVSSVKFNDTQVSFTIPEDYESIKEWKIHISGRRVSGGFSQSVHFYEDVNDKKSWEKGKSYSIALSKDYAELTLSASLPDSKGGTAEKSVSLLPSKKYSLRRSGSGEATTLTGAGAKLAEDIITDSLIKSAAWPGIDISTLEEYFQITETYSNGSSNDYYAFRLEGLSYLQPGKSRQRTRVSDKLYNKLLSLEAAIKNNTEAHQKYALEYYLFNTIAASPAYSSNPGDYIRAHQNDYNILVSGGENTLRYIYGEFLKGSQTGLNGHIMLSVMRDILGDELPDIETASNTQLWFDKWKDWALLNRSEIEKNKPKTAVLFELIK